MSDLCQEYSIKPRVDGIKNTQLSHKCLVLRILKGLFRSDYEPKE